MKSRLKISKTCLLVILLFFMAVPNGYGNIYLFINQEGDLIYTNRPTASDNKVFVKKKPSPALLQKIPANYDHIIARAARRFGLSVSLIKAVIKAESDYDPMATSKTGAMGLMQIMPDNASRFKLKDPYDPHENIMAGARYLKNLVTRFDGRIILALAAYNAGPGTVDRYDTIPPYEETELFVERVMTYYYVLKNRRY